MWAFSTQFVVDEKAFRGQVKVRLRVISQKAMVAMEAAAQWSWHQKPVKGLASAASQSVKGGGYVTGLVLSTRTIPTSEVKILLKNTFREKTITICQL